MPTETPIMPSNQPNTPIQQNTPTPNNNSGTAKIAVVIILIMTVFFLCICSCVGFVMLANNGEKALIEDNTFLGTSSTELTRESDVKLVYKDGNEFPPFNETFISTIESEMPLPTKILEYKEIMNAVGDPAYSFYFLVPSDFTVNTRKVNQLTYRNADESGDIGMLYYGVNDTEFDMSCKDLVESYFPLDSYQSYTLNSSSSVKINDENWETVNYTVVEDGYTYKGRDRCVKRDEALLNFYVYSNEDFYNANKSKIDFIMDNVFVAEEGFEWGE